MQSFPKVYRTLVVLPVLLLCLVTSCGWPDGARKNQDQAAITAAENPPGVVGVQTVVVAQPTDPYYSLAQTIAQTEQLVLVDTFADVFAYQPTYVILVAAPSSLTQEQFLAIGQMMRDAAYYPGLGIITGSTLAQATQLWARKDLVQASHAYLGGDQEVTQLVYEPTIFKLSDTPPQKIALTKASLMEELQQADYFYWGRHVGQVTWYWNEGTATWSENDQLMVQELPPLKPVVIYTPSCGSLRPWVADSIALGFVDHGAAAYIGNVNSPFHTGALLRKDLAVPGLSSWPEFPLGLVAQVENRAAVKAYFKTPQFFMLGDPRISLLKAAPYQILSDQYRTDGARVIAGTSTQIGMLAVKIANGAPAEYLTMKGVTAVSEHDLFHNSKLQTLNVGADKYILFLHQGGPFQIDLAPTAPVGWWLMDALSDALDYAWVVMWLDVRVVNAPLLAMVSLIVFVIVLGVKVFRQKSALRTYRAIFIVGACFTGLRLLYYWARFDDYTVSANLVNPTTFSILLGAGGLFANVAGGLMVIQDAKRVTGRLLGLVFAVLPQFVLTGFYLLFITLMNVAVEVTKMTAPWLWNYYAFRLPLLVLLVEMALLVGFSYALLIHRRRRAGKNEIRL